MGALERDGGSMHGWRTLSLRGKAAAWLISLSVDDHRRMRVILRATCWPTPEHGDMPGSKAEHLCWVCPASPWGRRGEGIYPAPPSPRSRKRVLRHPLSTFLEGCH